MANRCRFGTMDTYEDALRDAYLEKLYDEFGPEWAKDHITELNAEAIRAFTNERMQSYYLKHPNLAQAAVGMMKEMTDLIKDHPVAALLFATSSIEITIRDLLVKPMLSGLVHNETVAQLVVGLAPREIGSDGFKGLLFGMLKKVADVDLATHRRDGSNRMLWEEYRELQAERNKLIHSGISPSRQALAVFDSVALEFLNVIFPRVLHKLGIQITGYLMIGRDREVENGESDSPE